MGRRLCCKNPKDENMTFVVEFVDHDSKCLWAILSPGGPHESLGYQPARDGWMLYNKLTKEDGWVPYEDTR